MMLTDENLDVKTISSKPKYLWFLTLSYSMVLVLSNWFDPRLIRIFGLNTDAGTLIFPLTFLLSDLITEVYGYKHARRAILCGFFFNLLFIVYGYAVTHMPSPSYAVNNGIFDLILTTNFWIIFASFSSYVVSEPINSFIVAKLKIKMKGQYMGIRFLLSTLFAAGLDSLIFGGFAFYWTMNLSNLAFFILTMWFIKVCIEFMLLPFSIRLAKFLKKSEKLDIYDHRTNFKLNSFDIDYTTKDNKFLEKK